eukprot:7361149-Prymnesium_polylepis.1
MWVMMCTGRARTAVGRAGTKSHPGTGPGPRARAGTHRWPPWDGARPAPGMGAPPCWDGARPGMGLPP